MKIFGRKKLETEYDETRSEMKCIEADIKNTLSKIDGNNIRGGVDCFTPMVMINNEPYRLDYMSGFIEQCKNEAERTQVFPIWGDSFSDGYFKRDKTSIYHLGRDKMNIDFKISAKNLQNFIDIMTKLLSVADKYNEKFGTYHIQSIKLYGEQEY